MIESTAKNRSFVVSCGNWVDKLGLSALLPVGIKGVLCNPGSLPGEPLYLFLVERNI
jgi:hypothetical protein